MISSDNCILVERNKRDRIIHEENVKKNNKNYINEILSRLDEKDFSILKSIHFMKIAKSEQLEKIIYKNVKFGNRYMNNKLLKLFKMGCIDRFFPDKKGQGAAKQHVVLTKIGAKLLKIEGFRSIKKLNQNWRHTVAVGDVFAGLACKYKIHDWEYEMKLKFEVGSTDYEIRPDSFSHWSMNNKDNYAFFEIDLGTENQDILNKKIDAYHNYFFKSMDFRKHSWQPFDNPIIIPIIFVLNNQDRIKKLNSYYLKFVEKHSSSLKCYFTTFEKLI